MATASRRSGAAKRDDVEAEVEGPDASEDRLGCDRQDDELGGGAGVLARESWEPRGHERSR